MAKYQLSGLISGVAPNSIFSESDKGWIEVKLIVQSDHIDLENLENIFLKKAQEKIHFMKIRKVKELKIIDLSEAI